ncbi:MAG: toll/interleukin-1 receptor domain-containing protein [Rhodobacteraceae bacterium]|nr:toll/interleukin-1 receptor domain-containing protein [Paracoccaceae bacterium]
MAFSVNLRSYSARGGAGWCRPADSGVINGGISTRARDGRGDALDSLRATLATEIGRRRGRDFPLWIDRADIASGDRWRNEIQRGLSKARIFAPILPPSWLNSANCRDEFEAFNRYDLSRRGAGGASERMATR